MTIYVSPDGVEQEAVTPAEEFRLKYRGWVPKDPKAAEAEVGAPAAKAATTRKKK